MTTFSPTEVRASEIARGCDRMSVLRALGAEAREPDPEQQEWFQRGQLFEEYVVRQLVAKHGKDNVRRQVEIEHPLGVGHADALIVTERLLVEIKSTQSGSLSTPVFENGVAQLKLYLRFCPDADMGALYLINPSTLKPADVFPVKLTDEDVEEIDATIRKIQRHIEMAVLPDRACARPTQARGYFCPFAADCFDGWEPDPAAEITAPEALDAAARLAAIKTEKAQHAAAVRALEEGEKAAQAELAEHVDPGVAIVGPFEVKRTHVVMSPRFSEKAARAAGFPVESLAEFMSPGTEYDRWTVTAASDAGSVDYGEEAPY